MNSLFDNEYIDITANNNKGNKQSQDANVKIAPYKTTWREKILGYMAQRDAEGLGTSCRHAADHFGKEGGQIGGRFTELKVAGLIQPTGRTEKDYMVYRLTGSSNVPIAVTKRLLVVGPGLCAEAIFEKRTGGWQITKITPSLERMIADIPISELKTFFESKGLSHSWVG